MKSERTSTNSKMKLKRLLKQEINEIKKRTQDMKKELTKDMENLRKKESNRNPGNKMSLNSNKKYSCKPLQQTRTTGGQTFRAQQQSRY
jgi:hypothetical protein